MIFSKVYFPKVYLPKVYFSKCIYQNCIIETAVRHCGHGLALRFTNVYFPKCTFQKRIFQKIIFQSVCQKQKLNCTVAVRARIVMGIEGYQSVFFKVHYPKGYSTKVYFSKLYVQNCSAAVRAGIGMGIEGTSTVSLPRHCLCPPKIRRCLNAALASQSGQKIRWRKKTVACSPCLSLPA